MTDYVFPPPVAVSVPVVGGGSYAVGRIFCVGRNYAAHAAEMGNSVDGDAPFYFTKSATALSQDGVTMTYPPGTADLHHEVELVVALGAELFRATREQARAAVWGYATGLDMTRRDLQAVAKEGRKPWDTAKDFMQSAIVGPLTRVDDAGDIAAARMTLTVNGETRQEGAIADMIHPVEDILMHLSTLYRLVPSDIVMTGTPAGVGAVVPGDVLAGRIDGLAPVTTDIGPLE